MKLYEADEKFSFGSRPVNLRDVEELKKSGVKTVISIAPISGEVLKALKSKGISHFQVSVPQKTHYADAFRRIIVQVISQPNKVYVHCVLGESMSPTVAIGYLVSKGVPIKAAIAKIESKTHYVPIMAEHEFPVFESLRQSFKIRTKNVSKPKPLKRRPLRG